MLRRRPPAPANQRLPRGVLPRGFFQGTRGFISFPPFLLMIPARNARANKGWKRQSGVPRMPVWARRASSRRVRRLCSFAGGGEEASPPGWAWLGAGTSLRPDSAGTRLVSPTLPRLFDGKKRWNCRRCLNGLMSLVHLMQHGRRDFWSADMFERKKEKTHTHTSTHALAL